MPSVVAVRRMHSGSRYSQGTDGPRAVEVWQVEWDSDQTGKDQSLGVTHGGETTPEFGDVSPDYARLFAYEVTVEYVGQNLTLHQVTASYQIRRDNEGQTVEQQPGESDTPTSRPDRTERDWISERVGMAFAIQDDGTEDLSMPVRNSAGRALDPPPEREVLDPQWRITSLKATFTDTEWLTLNGSVNATTWNTYPPGTCRLRIRVGNETEGTTTYKRVEYSIIYRAEGWDIKTVDEGFMLDSTGQGQPGSPQLATDIDGNPVSEPILLDGNGQPLAAGQTPVLLPWQQFKRADWSNVPNPT